MESWTELALRARSGGQRELEELIAVSYGPTRRLCATLVDEQSADDLAQETFLRMAKGIRRFRGESSGRTWLFSIAHHVCASELRSRSRRRRNVEAQQTLEYTRAKATGDHADGIAVDNLLDQLDPERRAAFTLTQLYGLSYEETAVICRCAPGTVGSRVTRARHELVQLLHDSQGQIDATAWTGDPAGGAP